MCGIVGIANADGCPVDAAVLERMRDAMTHRGPDDSGIFIDGNVGLGHRRLSIIDLSGGRQPMSDADGTTWVIHNGEIYNFKELRSELERDGYSFRTQSDTEVIINAYRHWGVDCVKRLNGIFAFAVWDRTNRRLFAARDRLGIKPFYYTHTPQVFRFASEIKAFLQDPRFDRAVDRNSVDRYFTFGYIPAPDTIFSAAKKLLPAHYIVWEGGNIRTVRYWRFEPASDRSHKDAASWADEFKDVFRRAVSRQMVSDVPLGAFLSGGIDSSLIVWMMSEASESPVRTFTIGFGGHGHSETPYADVVAKRFATNHREYDVMPDSMDVLPRLIWHLDEPFADSSLLPTYYVSKITRQEVTVALSGDGGDELFAGYTRHQGEKLSRGLQNLPAWLRSGLVTVLRRPAVARTRGLRRLGNVIANAGSGFVDRYRNKESISQVVERTALYADGFASEVGRRENHEQLLELAELTASANYIDRLTVFDLEFYLPNDMLTKVDKMSMASALEVRVPFLDEMVLETAARVPAGLKLRGLTTKYLLRRLAAEVLPPEIWRRRKQGFGVPMQSWFEGRLLDHARTVLFDRNALGRGYFDRSSLEAVIDEHESGAADHSDLIFALICFEMWNSVFVDGGGERP